MTILIRQNWSPSQVRKAESKRLEFRPTRYTSGSANLDNMIALGKAVILCEVHTRRFSPKKARYRLHPAKRMQRVIGNCDVCRQWGPCFLFLNEKDAFEEQKKEERFRRAVEYAKF